MIVSQQPPFRGTAGSRPRAIAASLFALALASMPAAAGAQAEPADIPPQSYTVSPTGVNLHNGAFTYSMTDLSIGDLSIRRSLGGNRNSKSNYLSGDWSHNYDLYIAYNSSNQQGLFATVVLGDMSVRFYAYTQGAQPVYYPWDLTGKGTTLAKANGGFVFTNRAGDVYYFSEIVNNPRGSTGSSFRNQLATRVEYTDGGRLDFGYNGLGQLKTVTSNRGYGLVFDYSGPTGQSIMPYVVTAACGFNLAAQAISLVSNCAAAAVKSSYVYGQGGGVTRLTSATDTLGRTYAIRYLAANNSTSVAGISFPNSTVESVTNNYGGTVYGYQGDYVTSQQIAGSGTWTYSYEHPYQGEDVPQQPGQPILPDTAEMTDPAGATTLTEFSGPVPVNIYDAEGRLTKLGYAGAEVIGTIYPEGNSRSFDLDERGNRTHERRKPKSGNGEPELATESGFGPSNGSILMPDCASPDRKSCNKPIYTTDFNGNRTDYVYSPDNGAVVLETGPAVNGVRPTTRYTYEARYAGVKGAGGAIVPAASPVWLLTQEARCTSQATCNGPADETITTYEYGASGTANALLLRGKVVDPGGLNLRTCYSYDDRGNKISETSPRGTTGTCA